MKKNWLSIILAVALVVAVVVGLVENNRLNEASKENNALLDRIETAANDATQASEASAAALKSVQDEAAAAVKAAEDKAAEAAKAAAAPVAQPEPVAEEVTDDSELIAVIAAAIAAFTDSDKQLVVRKIRRVSGWNRAGRAEQVYRF